MAINTRTTLTGKQQRFVDEYFIDMNATGAARRAGYSTKTDLATKLRGFRLLRNPRIAAEIAKRQGKVASKLEITAERVINELAVIAFAPLGDEQVKTADKRAALVDLGKHLNLFVERHEVGKPGDFAALDRAALEARLYDEYRDLGISDTKARALVAAASGAAEGEGAGEPRGKPH